MISQRRFVVLLIVAMILCVGAYYGYRQFQDFGILGGWHTPLDVDSAVDCVLTWGRLAPIPEEARDFSIETAGTPFTRSFRARFRAEPGVIETWLKESPGTREAKVEAPRPGVRRYWITPGGGAARAEVFVGDARHEVRIEVVWN